MQVLRNIYTVTDNRIMIDLPEYFKYSAVEVIVLPIEKLQEKQFNRLSKNERLEKLLSISIWNDADIQPIIDTQNLINQWKIQEF